MGIEVSARVTLSPLELSILFCFETFLLITACEELEQVKARDAEGRTANTAHLPPIATY